MCKRALFAMMALVTIGAGTASLAAQDTLTKQYAVTADRALDVARDALTAQGFAIVQVKDEDDGDRVVLYRGKGRVERLVIRRIDNRIVFVDAPAQLLSDIDYRLRL
jgi:hypothetical protein